MFEYTLKKSELKTFRAVAGGKTRLSEIAGDTEMSISRTSQLLASLAKKDFVDYERKGRLKLAAANNAKHASLLKSLVQSGYPVEDVFSYSKLNILFSLLPTPKAVSNLANETRLAPETLRKYIRELKYLAVLFEAPGKKISLSPNPLMENFLAEYMSYVNRRVAGEIHEDSTLLWEHGLEIVLRIPLPHREVEAIPTGITAMSSYGISILSNYGYYYHTLFDHKLTVEDIAFHAILVGEEARNMSYALLLLKKAGYEKHYLIASGREYQLEELTREMAAFLEGEEVSNPVFPPKKEFEILCEQYGVN